MKILIMLLLLTQTVTAHAVITQEQCTQAGGRFIETHALCYVHQSMNWFNARSWCMSLGAGVDLVDLNTICKTFYQTGECPELSYIDAFSGQLWTQNVKNESEAYNIIGSTNIQSFIRTNKGNMQPLCQ